MKVSVCMITYNHEKYIAEAIHGVLNQVTDFSIELVIGDDGSTDNTRSILQEYQAQYPKKIRLNLQAQNIGANANFVSTYKLCEGEYIAVCEGDDYWVDHRKLHKQISFLDSHPAYVVSCSNMRYLNIVNNTQSDFINTTKESLEFSDLIEGNFIATQTVVYRKMPIDLSEEFYRLKVGDWPLHMLHADKGRIHHLNEITAVYRVHGANDWQGKEEVEKKLLATEALEYVLPRLSAENQKLAQDSLVRRYHLIIHLLLQLGDHHRANNILDKLKIHDNSLLKLATMKGFLRIQKKRLKI